MKIYRRILTTLAVALVTTACSLDEIDYSDSSAELEYGSVSFACTTLTAAIEATRADEGYTIPDKYVPKTDSLLVLVTGTYVDDNWLWADYSYGPVTVLEYNTELPFMVADGFYSAQIYYGDAAIEGDSAVYFNASFDFDVVARDTVTMEVSVPLENAIVAVSADEIFTNYYTDAVFTVVTGAENSFEFNVPTDKIVFVEADTELTLSGTATRNGQRVTFNSTSIGTTAKQTLSSINITASSVGSQTINITLDDTITQIEATTIELNPQ